jgi:hypothetical protein
MAKLLEVPGSGVRTIALAGAVTAVPRSGGVVMAIDSRASADGGAQLNYRSHRQAREAACRLIDASYGLQRAGRALEALAPSKQSHLVTVLRAQDRVDGIAKLVSAATKDLRLAGVDKDERIFEVGNEMISLQEATRRLRGIRAQLDTEALRARSSSGQPPTPGEPPQDPNDPNHPPSTWDEAKKGVGWAAESGSRIGGWVALAYVLGGWLAELFNGVGDDNARTQIDNSSPDQIRQIPNEELVNLINAMIDGFCGDDDERSILRILDALDCQRLSDVVSRVGVNSLLDAIDGEEWDRLVNVLTNCGIIGADRMDDDASRLFILHRSNAQLAQLPLGVVRQLILNMFSGSCGDDDEDSILRLLACQSGVRIHQLIAMPGTSVGAFDYNFDGDQWDDLETLFAIHGIDLDT